MKYSSFHQFTETGSLKEVIIGRYEGYARHEDYIEIVNEEQKQGLPSVSDLEKEFNVFKSELEKLNIEVHVPEYVGKFVYDQLTPRDIGAVIGDKFVVCPMMKASRKYEVAGIFEFIKSRSEAEPNILIPGGNSIVFEGGDIIVDHPFIFIGLSQRTNKQGADFLRKQFSDEFKVIEVKCKPLEKDENILHLDCTFNPVGKDMALIYPDGFEKVPIEISDQYELIEINRKEQQALATNVLSLDHKRILVRDHPDCQRVNQILRENGFELIELPFNAAPSTGGSFRCCSLPLYRR